MAVDAKTLFPQLKAIYLRQNRVLSDLDPVYSPGRRRKKYSIMIMLHSARRKGQTNALATLEI